MDSGKYKIDDEIDLGAFFRSLMRKKSIIISLGLGGMIYGYFLGRITPPIWRGEFQIVLNKSNQAPGGIGESQTSMLLNNIGLETNNKLTTEVKILESPSVLMKTYDFVRKEKLDKGIDFSGSSFSGWKNNNFEAYLTKGTTILNVAYQDQDKELIIPVLNNISKIYQDYSGRNRLRNLELGSKYFEEQIKIYRKKSKLSSAKADQYALQNALTASTLPSGTNVSSSFVSPIFKINLETKRINSKNRINLSKEKLLKINSMSNDPQEVLGMLTNLGGINNGLGTALQKVNSEIALNRAIYKEESEIIKLLYEKRKELVKSIKKQMIGFLNSRIENEEAIIKSTEREDKVFPTFKELLKEAQKDLQILNNLEGRYQILKLEKARVNDPWELITNPTLIPEPVEPISLNYIFSGLLFGTLSGCLIAIVIIKYQGKVYDFEKYIHLFDSDSIIELNLTSNDDFDEVVELISKTKLKNIKGNTSIISVGDIPKKNVSDLKLKFEKYLTNIQILLSKNVLDAMESENVFILMQKGITTDNDLKKYIRNFKILDKSCVSIIVIDELGKTE